jgi:hypothetical protein
LYDGLPVDGTIRSETTKDIVNDVLLYKAAALVKVRQAVAARTKDAVERKRLFTALKNDQWLEDRFLHRQVRKYFRHGKSSVANQFVVRSDKHTSAIVDGQLVVTLRVAQKYGGHIALTTTSSGKNASLPGSNLRIIVRDGFTEIHYATDKADGRVAGDQVLGIDKGYTEAFTDSDGVAHGQSFGTVLTQYSDAASASGKGRNKIHALKKKHRAAGHVAKADRMKQCNLGRKKLEARKDRAQRHLRTIAFQSAHSIVDKATVVVSEDLTSPIAARQQWRRYNRRMSGWAKGVLAEALDSVCTQRGAKHSLVNCAYTSQADSTNGLLQGKRVGDKFYRASGDVLQADHNAALNVLARLDDPDIGRFTPYKEVRRILLTRSAGATERHGLECRKATRKGMGTDSSVRQPSADKS